MTHGPMIRQWSPDDVVRAVNAHHALVEACERGLEYFTHTPDGDNGGLADCFRTALALAKGVTK